MSQEENKETLPEEPASADVVEETPPVDGGEEKAIEEQGEEGFFKSTLSFIRNGLKRGTSANETTEAVGDDEENLEGNSPDSASTEDGIPDDFSNVAESLGWTADEIVDFASTGKNGKPYTNKELLDMVPEMGTKQEEKSTPAQSPVTPSTPEEAADKKDDSKSAEVQLREQIKREILEELGGVKNELSAFKEEREREDNIRKYNRANELFDDMSKDIPGLGKTAELPKWPTGPKKGQVITSSPEFKARSEVYQYAQAFMGGGQNSFDDAMKLAFSTYQGKHMKDQIRQTVIKDMKKHERSLSGARTGKETTKSYSSEREEDIDFIRQLQEAAGREGR